jgi:protein ImuB
LVAVLRSRQARVQSLQIAFEHLQKPPTRLTFDWAEPVHERSRLSNLLRDRLERVVLPAPAVALRLSTGPWEPLAAKSADLFAKTPVETLAHVLLERLRGRLGKEAVCGMKLLAEHRPERAWSPSVEASPSIERAAAPLSPWAAERPLWLLPRPLPLGSDAARRHYEGSLELRSGPERIESGWWDEQDVGRDYFTAVSTRGQRLWIYRDRRAREWHLHGLFG